MKIVITGANGYIGSHVVKALLDENHEVIAIDLRFDKVDNRAIKFVSNIFDKDENFFEKWGNPDALIHLAWQDVPVHNSTSHIDNLPLHFHFIKNLVDNGLKQVIATGSMHDVGYFEGVIDENTPTYPATLYGIGKNTLRQVLEVYLKDKAVTFQWLRFFYTYGDDLNSSGSLFSKILQLENEGKDLFPFTDGKNQYDYLHVDKLASQIAAVVAQKEITGIINCCSGRPTSIKDKVEEFLKENNLKIKPEYGKFPSRPYDSPIIYGDSTKIDKILNVK